VKALLPALVAVVLVSAAPAGAQAPQLTLTPDNARAGRVGLTLKGPPGSEVAVSEDTDGSRPVGTVTLDETGLARISRAATWNCATRTRSFLAQGSTPIGTPLSARARTRTPSCAQRFRLRAKPKHPRATKRVKVRVKDTFALGDSPRRVCARGAGGLRTCARVKGKRATLRIPRPGRWRVQAKHARGVRLEVRRAPGPVSLLATGDSMIQIVDSYLDQRLSSPVRSDAHISSGLSKPFFFNWPAHAKRQVRSHPDVIVMFIGANDGFPFGDAQCCGKDWQRAYANRASQMMRTYSQGGAGSVYWCLLPAPRASNFRRVFVGVNAALRRAAKRHRGMVKLIDLPKTFTPGYRFRQTITWHGRTVSVRQDDGVHLNTAGASIAASIIISRMRRDGVL
jgi:lysophospholipase L1-like esterase